MSEEADMTVGACATTADCAEVTDGCCMVSFISSVAEDSVWGLMPEVVAGEQPAMCVSAADQATAEAATPCRSASARTRSCHPSLFRTGEPS